MNIVAVIVTYNPNIDCLRVLLDNLNNSCVSIIIVDNYSTNEAFKNTAFKSNVELLSLSKNQGIAFAQNVGIEKAIKIDADYILFFDQDSNVSNHFVDDLMSDYRKIYANHEKIAAIGPRFVDESKGFYFPALRFNKYGLIDKISVENISTPIEVSFLISSGTLISVETLKDIGLMKEEFFIDYVDTEWCFRALSKGYKLYMSEKAVMRHSVGDDTINLLNFKIPVHSGYRRYYRVRNLFFMWKMPYIPKILTSKLMITNFAIQILLFLLKDKKIDFIKYYFKAIKDGINQSRDYHV